MRHLFGHNPSAWVTMLVIGGVCIVLLAVKYFIFHHIRRFTKRSTRRWEYLLVRSIDFPLTLLLTAGGLAIGFELISTTEQWQKLGATTMKFLVALAMALFVRRLLLAIHAYYLNQQTPLITYAVFTRILITVAVYSVFLLIALDAAGISITPFLASLGAVGLALALSVQETLVNFFAGVYLLLDKPIRVGDYIKLESGDEGYVEMIGWRNIRIRQVSNCMIMIPNSKLANSIITNYNLPNREFTFVVDVKIERPGNLERLEEMIVEVATDVMRTVPGGVPEFRPTMRYQAFSAPPLSCQVALRAREFAHQYLLRNEFIKRLQQRLDTEDAHQPTSA